jgi:hypothetical protein
VENITDFAILTRLVGGDAKINSTRHGMLLRLAYAERFTPSINVSTWHGRRIAQGFNVARHRRVVFGVVVAVGIATCALIDFSESGQSAAPFATLEPVTDFTHKIPPVLATDSEPVLLTLPFTNPTCSPVKLGQIQCSCTCLEATLSKTELAVGEAAELRYDVRTQGTSTEQTFICTWADDSERRWSGRVLTTFYRDQQTIPDWHTYGVVGIGTTHTTTLIYRQVGRVGPPLPAVPTLSVSDPAFAVECGPASPVEEGRYYIPAI